MEEDIGQLKSVLRSLVVSSPTQVDVRGLLRDYRSMIGSPVPFRKFGYNNPIEFLKERFSDCFLFSGVVSNPVLTLIVPDALKHIDKFVQKQKSSSTNKFNPKRRSVPEEVVNPNWDKTITKVNKQKHILSPPIELSNDSHVKSFSKLSINPLKSQESLSKPITHIKKANISCREFNGSATSKMVNNVPCTGYAKHNGDVHVQQTNDILEDKKEAGSKADDSPTDSTNAVKKFLKKRLPLYNSQQNLYEEFGEQCITSQDDDSGRHTSSSGNSAKAQQLERLRDEIMQIIADAPGGVWCTDLLKLYRERYNRELNFNRFGYMSIISLVYCMEGAVQITRPELTGDWLLQERRRAAPAPATLRPRRRALAPLAPAHPRQQPDEDDALPGIDFDPDVFPEDCMYFTETIESISMHDLRPGAMVEVMIGEVYSPSHFWFIRLGDNYNIAMEDMMDDMSRYYRNEGKERVLARGAVRVGHYCSTLYENDWHRSLIVKIIDSDTVKVRHVDYGTVDTVCVRALRPLRREWARLPAQAARARLAGVRPPAAGWRWPHAACTAFLALVSNKRLVANVVAVDDQENVAEVLLIDTSSAEDVCIGTELTRAGHADARPDSALRTPDVYLFPRFEALESGATPNYAEVHAYLRDGIALDYVRAYRDHVPAPPAHPYLRAPAHHEPHEPHTTSEHTHSLPLNEPPQGTDSIYVESSCCDSESLDSCQFTLNAIECDPLSPVESRVPIDDNEANLVSGISLRIPLLLPDTLPISQTEPPQPEISPVVVPESTPPTQLPGRPPLQPTQSRSSERLPLLPTPTRSTKRPIQSYAPTSTSHLSPHAPAYIPGSPYRTLPRPECPAPGPACPAGYEFSPPPYGGSVTWLPPPGVTLSVAECETYRALSQVNPAAAHWFIVGAMGRATAAPPGNPPHYSAPPQVLAPPPAQMYAPPMSQMHPPVRIRPPPGFGSF